MMILCSLLGRVHSTLASDMCSSGLSPCHFKMMYRANSGPLCESCQQSPASNPPGTRLCMLGSEHRQLQALLHCLLQSVHALS